jgi:hypothetical protein
VRVVSGSNPLAPTIPFFFYESFVSVGETANSSVASIRFRSRRFSIADEIFNCAMVI